jgi:hypothetical protein
MLQERQASRSWDTYSDKQHKSALHTNAIRLPSRASTRCVTRREACRRTPEVKHASCTRTGTWDARGLGRLSGTSKDSTDNTAPHTELHQSQAEAHRGRTASPPSGLPVIMQVGSEHVLPPSHCAAAAPRLTLLKVMSALLLH